MIVVHDPLSLMAEMATAPGAIWEVSTYAGTVRYAQYFRCHKHPPESNIKHSHYEAGVRLELCRMDHNEACIGCVVPIVPRPGYG